MGRLDDAIAEVAYVLDCLMALRDIYKTGRDCNTCHNRNCECRPAPGMQIRYNCAFYAGAEKEK